MCQAKEWTDPSLLAATRPVGPWLPSTPGLKSGVSFGTNADTSWPAGRYKASRARTDEHLGPPTIPGGKLIYLRRLKAGKGTPRYDAVWLAAEVMHLGLLGQ